MHGFSKTETQRGLGLRIVRWRENNNTPPGSIMRLQSMSFSLWHLMAHMFRVDRGSVSVPDLFYAFVLSQNWAIPPNISTSPDWNWVYGADLALTGSRHIDTQTCGNRTGPHLEPVTLNMTWALLCWVSVTWKQVDLWRHLPDTQPSILRNYDHIGQFCTLWLQCQSSVPMQGAAWLAFASYQTCSPFY